MHMHMHTDTDTFLIFQNQKRPDRYHTDEIFLILNLILGVTIFNIVMIGRVQQEKER